MWAVLIAGLSVVSAFTIHQHSSNQYCVDLQCPATAFDYGVKNLVSEETLSSEECKSCKQCTDSGYSICMQMKGSRASRTQSSTCSCAHSVPANCHNRLSSRENPANITMSLYQMCYLSALQAPPKALVTNEEKQVVIEIEPFWKEDYWRELEVDNVTLHYDYVVKVPEHCDGEVVTKEGTQVEHLCKNSLHINMTAAQEDGAEAQDGQDDYEHSDNYDQYDDELPPEVGVDRIVFAGAKLLTVYYKVDVRRPRQLVSDTSDPFRDTTTNVESEIVKFDLKPEVYGTGIAEPVDEKENPEEDDGVPTNAETKPEDEDVSEEPGDGTDFFEDDKKETASEQKEEEEEEALAKQVEDQDDEEKKKENEEKETEESQKKEDEDTETTEEEEDTETTTAAEEEEKDTDADEETADEKKEENDPKNDDTDEETERNEDDKALDGETDMDKKEETEDIEDEDADDEDVDEDEEGSGDDDEEEKPWYHKYFQGQNKMVKYVFAGTMITCFFILITVFCYRRKCCCGSTKTKQGSNGYRYTNPNRNADLVSPPEKERLHQ